jgi:hypothetical protein
MPNTLIDLKPFRKEAVDSDSAVDRACELVRCSVALLISDDFPESTSTAPVLTDEPYTTDAEPDEDSPIADLYRKVLVHFNEMTEEERLGFDPYHSTWEIGRNRIAELTRSLEWNPEAMIFLYSQWLFDPGRDTQFVLDQSARESVNSLWRVVYRYEEWTAFADLALHLDSCWVSEADAQRVLSMQINIAGLYGTRFGIRTMDPRLRSARTLPGRRPGQDEVLLTSGYEPAGMDEGGSDASFEDMDPELDDDADNEDDDSDAE